MSSRSSQKLIVSIFFFTFIFIYLLILAFNNSINKTSFILYLGFFIVILGFFLFVTLHPYKEKNRLFGFKVFSENLIKITLVISMSFALFIPPVAFTTTVMDWNQIGINNYVRAFIFIIGGAFLPGACAFNMMFPNSAFHEKYKTEPFFLKITFYPIFSFILIGISVLILDRIGLIKELFSIALFLVILTLFISDLLVQFFRRKNILKLKFTEINVSKHTFYILIIAVGYSLFTIGVQITMEYLIPGDAWVGLRAANFIGNPNLNPNSDVKDSGYPRFWGYIIFGLGQLSGIPYININVLLTPFSYLSVTSMYLFMKAILGNYKEVYSVLATMFVSLFAGIFFLTSNSLGMVDVSFGGNNPGSLRLALDYKNFAYILFNFSMGLFITSFKTTNLDKRRFYISPEEFKILLLSALFLLTSYMIYLIPFIAGIYIPFLYCLFSGKIIKKRIFHFFTIFLFLFISLFIIFDILSEFLLSFLFYTQFNRYIIESKRVVFFLEVYGILWGLFILFVIFQILYTKFFYKNKKKKNLILKINAKYVFFGFLTIFTCLLIILIYNTINSDYVYAFIYYSDNEWYYLICIYLNHIFLNIGIIGIVGVYLSYFCFKTNRNLFYFLTSWIIFSFIMASILFFTIYANPDNSISGDDYFITNFWFHRNWVYAIPSLSILASIGVINLEKKLKNLKFKGRTLKIKNQNLILILKLSLASILIFSSYSSIVVSGLQYGSDKKMKDVEAQVVGWITKEIPLDSNIIGERSYNIEHAINTLTESDNLYYSINYIFLDEESYESQIYKLKDLNIQYAIFYTDNHPDLPIEQEDFIDDYLIPKIYYKVLYKYKNIAIYYAPDLEDDVCRELNNCEDIPSSHTTEVLKPMGSNVSMNDSNRYSRDEKDFYRHKNTTQIYENNCSNLIYAHIEYPLKENLL